MDFNAAIFDMDGTLIDSLFLWEVFWREAGIRYLGDPSFRPNEEDDKAVRTITLRNAMYLIHEHYDLAESGEELFAYINGIITDFYANRVQMKDGALEWLEYCKANGIRMCIASATAYELIELAMQHCGITGFFEKIFSCSVIGKGKEEPDIYLAAQDYFALDADKICVFEDSLVAIETAKSIGMHTVAVYDRFNYGQDRMRELADAYIAEGESLMKLKNEQREVLL